MCIMNRFNIIGATLAVILLASNPVLAVYKWTDQNNVTHYDQFPPTGQQAEEIKTTGDKVPKIPAKAPAADSSPQKNQAADGPADTSADKQQKAAADRSAAMQKENCAKARQNLAILENNQRIRIPDKGDYRVLSEQERQQQINGLKERITATCQEAAEQTQE